MAGNLQDFISQMQQKFQPSERLTSGPTVEQVLPFAQRYGIDPELLTMPQNGNGNGGTRFTGRGPSDQVAGVVEKNEMVLEKDMVQNLGGPEQARGKIDELAKMSNEVETPRNRGNRTDLTTGLPSFQQGTGADTAGGVVDKKKPPTEEERVSRLNLPDVDKPVTDRFKDVTTEGVKGIQKLARGESQAIKVGADISREQLAGRQAAESAEQLQSLAQRGAAGGTAQAAIARERRQAGIETGALEAGIRQERTESAERATRQLADVGLRGEALEEGKRQFGIQTKQRQAEFKENVRQFGENFAANKEQQDFQNNQVLANIAMDAGDFDAAGKVYENMGVNVDTSRFRDEQSRKDFGDAMANFETSLAAGFGFEDPTVQNQLTRAAETQGIDVDSPEGKTWMQNTFNTRKLRSDPIRSAIEDISSETWDSMAATAGFENIDDFEFNGQRGAAAFKDAWTGIATGGGMNPDGTIDESNPVWNSVFKEEALEKSVKETTETDVREKAISNVFGTDADKVISAGREANPDLFDEVSTARTEAITSEPFGTQADTLLKAGRDKDPKAFDAVVNTRSKEIIDSGDLSSLKGKGPGDPVYDKVVEDTPLFDTGGFFQKSGNNQQNFSATPPDVGSTIIFNGKIFLVDSEIQVEKKTGARKEFQFFTVKDPNTGKVTRIKPKGLRSSEFSSLQK